MSESGTARPCPICGRPVTDSEHRPFCSARCRRVDLGRWLGEVYRAPAESSDAPGSEADEDDTEE